MGENIQRLVSIVCRTQKNYFFPWGQYNNQKLYITVSNTEKCIIFFAKKNMLVVFNVLGKMHELLNETQSFPTILIT